MTDAANEDLAGAFLLIAGDSTLGVNLKGEVNQECRHTPAVTTYDLAIKLVFLDHDNVDRLRVSEGEKAESTGAACGAIAHYRAFNDLAELCEIVT